MNRLLATLVTAVLLSMQPAVTVAQPREDRVVPVQRVSLDDAVGIAQRQVSGQVIGADTRSYRGRIVHEVRILDGNGRLHIVRVDGESGRVLR